MRAKLENYVCLLFAGTTDTEEIQQEILQNTLDRYDDLISQGKAPEAAYRLAITGIGDINEILSQQTSESVSGVSAPAPESVTATDAADKENRSRRAAAIAFYIACPIPLFALGNEIGLCLMLMLIAAATALMVMSSKKKTGEAAFVQSAAYSSSDSRRSEQTQKQIKTIGIINLVICLSVYLVVSFLTGAWIVTWLLFPLFACIHGLIVACIDLKEAT
jgi:hypothetical protein